MTLLQNFHGTIAVFLILALLFAEEAGVPLLFASGDLLLVAAGILIAIGGVDPRLFLPLATLTCITGAVVGYTWSRRLGAPALRSLAARLRAERQLDRVLVRVRGAGAAGVAVARLIPGLRVYTTLAAGAAGVEPRPFLLGVTSATVVWVIGFTALGAIVGIPAERFLGQFEQLGLQGVILLLGGAGAYLVLRRAPADSRGAIAQIPAGIRVPLALVLDAAIVAAVAAGLLTGGRLVIGSTANAWIDVVMVGGAILLLVLAITLRRAGPMGGAGLRFPGAPPRSRGREA